ncbi:MAG: hypothetical protein ACE5G0_06970 [Rhodothermales bacterium]
MHDRCQPPRRTLLLQVGQGLLLLALFPTAVCAQIDRFDTKPPESDALFAYLSIGRSKPTQPADFTDGWENGLNLRLAMLYQFHDNWGVEVAFEHTGFHGRALPFNPEIRLFTIIPSLSFSRAGSVVTPYGRLGIGYLLQGTRRVRIRDGVFHYSGGFFSFSSRSGLVATGDMGVTIRITRTVYPFVEVSYLAGRASSATIGHLSFRAGVMLSLGLFARSIDPETTRDPQREPRRK